MSDIPEDAQLSEDGQWWWDGSDWQPVQGGGDAGGGDAGGGDAGGGDTGGGDAEQGTAAFDFDQSGLRIDAEESPTPSAGEGLKAAFSVWNLGTAAGTCTVTFTIDGSDSGVTWQSPSIEPNAWATPDGDGYVHGLPGQSEGRHVFAGYTEPSGPNGGTATNEIDIGAAE